MHSVRTISTVLSVNMRRSGGENALPDKMTSPPPEAKSGVISMHDFLDFLKLTCQVNESLDSRNVDKELDYNLLAKNELVNSILVKGAHATSPSSSFEGGASGGLSKDKSTLKRRTNRKARDGDNRSSLDPSLHDKLDEVINEGILDSVLPFICPSMPTVNAATSVPHTCNKPKLATTMVVLAQPPNASTSKLIGDNNLIKLTVDGSSGKKSDYHLNTHSNKDRFPRRKSIQSINNVPTDSEVTIHVCDEVKSVSRDFSCPQKLLVAKMGYFADVTAGQRLEDMDISVHCDLQIFDWLMRWVKRETVSQEMWPRLDPTNVVPILVSASFLQMEPLLVDCLSFCHSHLNDVVKASANLSCLNDNIISRLAAMFTNTELEMVKDKKERVTPRLWTKLIQSLCEPEQQSLRGHYASLADLFRCNRKYLTQSVSSYIYCLPQNLRLNRWGQIISQHARDPAWNITNYVAALYKELRSWRKVYWRLWGNCHFLYCATCETHFPVYQMNWCLYHPDAAQFLGPVTEGRIAGPAGRYPCCGQQAFRYETVPGPAGCQFREHTVQIETDRDRAILKLAQLVDEGGCLYELPPPSRPHSSGTVDPWWNGIALTPNRDRQGLLPTLNLEGDGRTRSSRKLTTRPSIVDSSSETESSDNPKRCPVFKQFSTSSDGCESDYSSPRPVVRNRHRCPRRKIKVAGRHWSGDISARSNQDNQREFEERAMKQVIALVGKRTGSEMNNNYHSYQQGGTYVRLEAEWRESMKHKPSGTKNKSNK